MTHQPARSTVAVLVATLLAPALAGCFSEPGGDEPGGAPADRISRAWSLTLDDEADDELSRAEDPFALLEEMLDASLVVRVGEAGAYTLAFTDSDGTPAEIPLENMAAGVPRTVPGVHPFAEAVLKRGDEVVARRAPIPFEGFRVGDVPLGFVVEPGAETAYAYRLDAANEVRVDDISGENGMHLRALAVDVRVPLRGELTLGAPLIDLSGTRLDLASSLRVVPPGDAPLARAEVDVTVDGVNFTGGIELRALDAALDGGASFWFTDGAISAAQLAAGAARVDPTIVAWGEGDGAGRFVDECAGASRADACELEHPRGFDESWPQGEREDFDGEAWRATQPSEQTAVRLLERLFATGLEVDDAFTFAFSYDSRQHEHERSILRWTFSVETTVVERGDVEVPAGTFDAYQIAQEARMVANVESLQEGRYDYENNSMTYEEVVRDLAIDEVLARHTIWLHAGTFQPVKVESTTPLAPDGPLARVLGGITDEGWREMGLDPVTPDDIGVGLTVTSSIEATKLATDIRLAPAAGLLLATTTGGGGGFANGVFFGMFGGFPMRHHREEAVPVPPPPYPTATPPAAMPPPRTPHETQPVEPSFSIGLMDTPRNETAQFMVRTTMNLSWPELVLELDGATLVHDTGRCDEVAPETFRVCFRGEIKSTDEPVWSGDELWVGGVGSGETLRVLHKGRVLAAFGMP